MAPLLNIKKAVHVYTNLSQREAQYSVTQLASIIIQLFFFEKLSKLLDVMIEHVLLIANKVVVVLQ